MPLTISKVMDTMPIFTIEADDNPDLFPLSRVFVLFAAERVSGGVGP